MKSWPGKKARIYALMLGAAFFLTACEEIGTLGQALEILSVLFLVCGPSVILTWFLSKKLGKDYKAQHGVAIALCVLSVALTFLVVPMFVLAPAGVMLSVISWIKFKRQMDQKGETGYWIAGLLNAIPLLCTTSIVSFQVYIFHTARWN